MLGVKLCLLSSAPGESDLPEPQEHQYGRLVSLYTPWIGLVRNASPMSNGSTYGGHWGTVLGGLEGGRT